MITINITIGGQAGQIVLPDDFSAANTYHLIVWHHGMGDSSAAVPVTGIYGDVVNALLPLGYIFCASIAHGDVWGNDDALADYAALITYVQSNYSIDHTAFWGGSMGGPSALVTLAQNDIKGAFLIYPVCNLGSIYNDLSWADSSINSAYNIPGGGSYEVQTAGHDPILRPVSEYAGKRFRFTASPDDTFVPKATNSDAFATYVSGVAAEVFVIPISGEHGVQDGIEVNDCVAFFERALHTFTLDMPVINNPITLHTPAIGASLQVPLLQSTATLFTPRLDSQSRPLSEDYRIIRIAAV